MLTVRVIKSENNEIEPIEQTLKENRKKCYGESE